MRVCLYAYMCACVCVEGMVVSMSSVCNHGKSELEGIAVKAERVTGRHPERSGEGSEVPGPHGQLLPVNLYRRVT